MTLKLQKKRALELVAKGFKLDDIAEMLQVSLRTVQRWVKDLGVATNEPEVTVDPLTESALEQNQNLREKAIGMLESGSQPDDIAKELISPDLQSVILTNLPNPPGWVQERESVLAENQKYHQAISRKLNSILHGYLDNPEINVRNIDRLSQAFTRHTNSVIASLDHRWSDMSKALHLLTAYGYSVVDMAQIAEDRRKREAKLSSSPSPPPK